MGRKKNLASLLANLYPPLGVLAFTPLILGEK